MYFCVEHWVGDRCVAVYRDLNHHCALPTEVHICDSHLLAFRVNEKGARTYLPHLYSSRGIGQERASRETRLSGVLMPLWWCRWCYRERGRIVKLDLVGPKLYIFVRFVEPD